MVKSDLLIVGGGWAGLAAATYALRCGNSVTLLERASQLGGRCFSLHDTVHDRWYDNGMHLLVKAYTATERLLAIWGVKDGIDYHRGSVIVWVKPGGELHKLRLSGGVVANALSLMSFGGMSVSHRLKSARVALAMKNAKLTPDHDNETVSDFLSRYGLQAGDAGGLWDALSVAVLNSSPHVASVKTLINSVKAGLLVGGENGRLGLPRKPIQELLAKPALDYLTKNGVEILLRHTATGLQISNRGEIEGVLVGEKLHRARKILLALPPWDILRFVDEPDAVLGGLDLWETSPITSIDLIFNKPVIGSRPIYFEGGFVHWLFGVGDDEGGRHQEVSCIISHSVELTGMTSEQIVDTCINEMERRLPNVRDALVIYSKVIKSPHATSLLKPGMERLRPGGLTNITNLFVAGDWCATGLPITIESAVRSGKTALNLAFNV